MNTQTIVVNKKLIEKLVAQIHMSDQVKRNNRLLTRKQYEKLAKKAKKAFVEEGRFKYEEDK